ncbi:MAG: hypothetical protein QE271_04855 [Bacteriovoracaceae bacterium]|nr:hypothetical protein [Bacteriovoracaceae bacterium]
MNLNLAEWKYRNVVEDRGGPLLSLSYYSLENYPGHHCFAELRPELIPLLENKGIVYREGGGQGSDQIGRAIASYKAISESLERWAFYQTYKSDKASQYKFDIDPTTSGMACYPGITFRPARRLAMKEAIERWSIIAWWDGLIANKKINKVPFIHGLECNVYRLEEIWKGSHTVILQSVSLIKSKNIYAFATSSTIESAISKAMEELCRNSRSIDRYVMENNFTNDGHLVESIKSLGSIMEKRLIFFATQSGKQMFESRCDQKINSELKRPELIVDREIIGPWSKYATVWRCLFKPTSTDFLKDSAEYFLF